MDELEDQPADRTSSFPNGCAMRLESLRSLSSRRESQQISPSLALGVPTANDTSSMGRPLFLPHLLYLHPRPRRWSSSTPLNHAFFGRGSSHQNPSLHSPTSERGLVSPSTYSYRTPFHLQPRTFRSSRRRYPWPSSSSRGPGWDLKLVVPLRATDGVVISIRLHARNWLCAPTPSIVEKRHHTLIHGSTRVGSSNSLRCRLRPAICVGPGLTRPIPHPKPLTIPVP